VGLILAKASVMRISIPLDLSSTLSFLPGVLSKWRMEGSFLRGLSAFLTLRSFSVTLFPLGSRLFLIQLQINKHYSSVNPVANKHTLQLCCLWIRFVSQGVVCFHSVDFGGHTLDSQYAPRFFVDNLRQDSQVLARLHTKQVISHFFLH
jgi:hypothetical protein